MTNAIIPYADHPLWLVAGTDATSQSRVGQFVAWQTGRQPWYAPNLGAYRDDLIAEGLAPSTVSTYLSTIRGAYRKLTRSNGVRDLLMAMAPPDAPPERKHAIVEEALARLRNATHPDESRVKQIVKQDEATSEHIRLTVAQAEALLDRPGTDTLLGLRDTAILAVFLCTGVREAELADLIVPDLWEELGTELALLVREGKGGKQRLVPYGELDWCLSLVEDWLDAAGHSDGPVFRGFWPRGGVRPDGISPRTIHRIVTSYPAIIDGKTRTVRPHDLRRSYAKIMYDEGMDIVAIQQNLGHTKLETTMRYIGELNASRRRGRGLQFRWQRPR